jgi:hypothetical protein
VIVDVLEHLPKEQARSLLSSLQFHCTKILAFTPLGFDEQSGHDEYDFARPGLKSKFTDEQREIAIEAQRHKSGWTSNDFVDCYFNHIITDRNYHRKGEGAIWARWDKE